MVAGAHTRDDAVDQGNLSAGARHEASDVRKKDASCDLADVRALSTHVGPCNDLQVRLSGHHSTVV